MMDFYVSNLSLGIVNSETFYSRIYTLVFIIIKITELMQEIFSFTSLFNFINLDQPMSKMKTLNLQSPIMKDIISKAERTQKKKNLKSETPKPTAFSNKIIKPSKEIMRRIYMMKTIKKIKKMAPKTTR